MIDMLLPLLRCLDPETAHRLSVLGLKTGLFPRAEPVRDPILRMQLFGLDFPHPLGMSPGFDKSAEAWRGLLRLGVGFAEVGTLTPLPQLGNAKPRSFRLPEDFSAINRNGFNNDGLDAGIARLQGRDPRLGILGINVGANKDAESRVADYVQGVRRTAELADYLTINVSSPNTPGLRDLQAREPLSELLGAVMTARSEVMDGGPAILLKIAPDLGDEQIADIVDVAMKAGIDGMIISNTTIDRPDSLTGRDRAEAGGLSGRPLFARSTRVLAEVYSATGGRLPLIGIGGIEDADTAYAKVRAGASLLQIYTALIYKGPRLFREIPLGLAERLRADGFGHLSEAVGVDVSHGSASS